MTDFLMERGLQTLVVAFSENEPVATFRRLTKPCSFSSDILIRSALDRGGPRTSKNLVYWRIEKFPDDIDGDQCGGPEMGLRLKSVRAAGQCRGDGGSNTSGALIRRPGRYDVRFYAATLRILRCYACSCFCLRAIKSIISLFSDSIHGSTLFLRLCSGYGGQQYLVLEVK
jgi:hypothetical protein